MIEFFDITNSRLVLIDENSVQKEEIKTPAPEGGLITKYILRATDDEGNLVHKFCTKEEFDNL